MIRRSSFYTPGGIRKDTPEEVRDWLLAASSAIGYQDEADRPNPNYPEDEDVFADIAEVRAIIALNPRRWAQEPSPVHACAVSVVGENYADIGRVVEGVLADRSVRAILNAHGMHSGKAAKRKKVAR